LLGTKGGGGLEAFFAPQNIAVIGATERAGSIGGTLVRNLISSPFGGTVFPVNPKRRSVLGIKTHPRIGAVPDPIDLAIVATPAPTVPDAEQGGGRLLCAHCCWREGFAGMPDLRDDHNWS
jgi:acetyltransferase